MQKHEMITCKTFKILGLLLCYPSQELLDCTSELLEILAEERLVKDKDLHDLAIFIAYLQKNELLTLQEKYVELFDRNKALSLHLFEHVHGESRERGEAMISLLDIYKEYGFSAIENELPDYIPLFLEFLSCIEKEEAIVMLSDPEHIFLAIGKRLKQYTSEYSAVFIALSNIVRKAIEGNSNNHQQSINNDISIVMDDDSEKLKVKTFAELDKEWEEIQVDFMGAMAPNGNTNVNGSESKQSTGCGGGKCGACSDK